MLIVIGLLLVTGVWESWTRHLQTTLVSGFQTVL
jgi:cytochrome c-type biogenesis protein